MVFENEVNLYDKNRIINEFHTQSTQLQVVQGKISAVISDSQIQELQNGGTNMYTKMSAIEQSVDGISASVSSMSSEVDGIREWTLSQINLKADEIDLEVSNNYAAKASIIATVNADTSGVTINAGKISLAGKAIDLTSDNITISSNNFTVDKYGNIKASNGEFSGKVTATSGTIGGWTLSSSKISGGTYAGSGQAYIQVPSSSSTWVFGAGQTSSSSYASAPFRVRADGYLVATNANISGTLSTSDLTATGGTIGGWTISSSSISGGTTSTGGAAFMRKPTSSATWVFGAGQTGSSSGTAPFRVRADGYMVSSSGQIGGFTIGGSSISNNAVSLEGEGITVSITGQQVGKIGAVHAVNNPNFRGLHFGLNPDHGDFMSWGIGQDSDLEVEDPVMMYCHTADFESGQKGVISMCKPVAFLDGVKVNGAAGVTKHFNFVQIQSIDQSTGVPTKWRTNCYMSFSHGILTQIIVYDN